MARAFVFPGQGAQTIGMGQALAEAYPAARAVFAEVDDALEQSLSDLIWNGDIETLTLTTNATQLAGHAEALYKAGVRRVNISLDTLDRPKFAELTRRDAELDDRRGERRASTPGRPKDWPEVGRDRAHGA